MLVIGSFVIILVMCGVCDAKRTEGGHRTRAGRGMNDRVNGYFYNRAFSNDAFSL